MRLRTKYVTRAYDDFVTMLSEFDDKFMFGMITGIFVLSIIFYRFRGMAIGDLYNLDIAFSPYGQFHLVSIDLFFILIPISYWCLRGEKNNGKRVLASLCFPLVVFSLHDMVWLVETFWVPQTYRNGVTLLPLSWIEYVHHFSKNIINGMIPMAYLLYNRYFRVNKAFLAAFAGMAVFHAVNIVYQINVYVLDSAALLFMELIDTVPYLLLLRRR